MSVLCFPGGEIRVHRYDIDFIARAVEVAGYLSWGAAYCQHHEMHYHGRTMIAFVGSLTVKTEKTTPDDLYWVSRGAQWDLFHVQMEGPIRVHNLSEDRRASHAWCTFCNYVIRDR